MVFSFTKIAFYILGHLPSNISSMTRSYPAEVRCVSGTTHEGLVIPNLPYAH